MWRRIAHFCALSALGSALGCGSAEKPRPAEPRKRSARARLEKPQSELSPQQVVSTLRGNETDLRRCFFANPGARGFVRFSWDLDESGIVTRVKNEYSSIGDERVEGCLAERLAELKFGELAGPSRARWAFVFRLVDPPPKVKGRSRSKKKKLHPDDEGGVSIDPSSRGKLETDVVDRVIEAGYPLFARCYRDGVQRNNDIRGALRLRFEVNERGSVVSIADGGSDLSDRQVVDCVAEAFFTLRFPEPKTGSVEVLYKIHFGGSARSGH